MNNKQVNIYKIAYNFIKDVTLGFMAKQSFAYSFYPVQTGTVRQLILV